MLEENGVHYIYIGDIGNNHSGHCRGVNWPQMRAIKFPEPDLDQLRYIHIFDASIHAFIFQLRMTNQISTYISLILP